MPVDQNSDIFIPADFPKEYHQPAVRESCKPNPQGTGIFDTDKSSPWPPRCTTESALEQPFNNPALIKQLREAREKERIESDSKKTKRGTQVFEADEDWVVPETTMHSGQAWVDSYQKPTYEEPPRDRYGRKLYFETMDGLNGMTSRQIYEQNSKR